MWDSAKLRQPVSRALPAVIAAALTLLLAFCAYLPGLKAGFYFDDRDNIVERQALHWNELSESNLRSALSGALLPRRPVANLSFALNHLFTKLDPAPYHWTNLAIHLCAGGALAWVAWWLCGEQRRRPNPGAVLAGTALFLLHPLNAQAVTYVVQRMTSLATLFVLLALGLYVSARRGAAHGALRYGGAGAAWLVALGCKEIAVATPVVLLLYEACFHRRRWRRRWAAMGGTHRTMVIAAAGLAGIATVAAVVALPTLRYWGTPLPGREFTLGQRLLTQPRAQLFYLGLLAWPAPGRLNLEHDFAWSRDLLHPWSTLPAIVLCLAAIGGAVLLARRRPRYGFPLLAYVAFHLIESGPLNLELVFEHRMYLPGTMLAVLAAVTLSDAGRARRFALAVTAAVVMALAGATYARNLTWADPLTFFRDCAAKAPRKFRPQYNLGTELGTRGLYSEAERALLHALELKPGHSYARNQLGNIYLMTGRDDAAFASYRAAVASDPGNAEAQYNLASTYETRGDFAAAADHYRRFVDVAPPPLEAQRRRVAAKLRMWGAVRPVP